MAICSIRAEHFEYGYGSEIASDGSGDKEKVHGDLADGKLTISNAPWSTWKFGHEFHTILVRSIPSRLRFQRYGRVITTSGSQQDLWMIHWIA